MAETAVELVRRMLDRFQSGDAEGALACFSSDVVTEVKGRADASIGHGRQELGEIIGS